MPDPRERGFLYVARSLDLESIKVGFAVSPHSRLPSLQTGTPHELYIAEIVPIERGAEAVFHEIMRPHRIRGEWYPDDALMGLVTDLIETWGDKVQATNDGSMEAWATDGDTVVNPLGVYLTAGELRTAVMSSIEGYFAMTIDDWEGDPPPPVHNHWAPNPRAA